MFITYKEVHEDINRAEPGSIIGRCGLPRECLVAKAVWHKYPDLIDVSVSVPPSGEAIAIHAVVHAGWSEIVKTGSDGHKLYELAKRFDLLGQYGHPVTREEALELFR